MKKQIIRSLSVCAAAFVFAGCVTQSYSGARLPRESVGVVKTDRGPFNWFHPTSIEKIDGVAPPDPNNCTSVEVLPGQHTFTISIESDGYGSAPYPYSYSYIRSWHDEHVTIDVKAGKTYRIHTVDGTYSTEGNSKNITITVNYNHWFTKDLTLEPKCSYSGMAYNRTNLNLKFRVSFTTDSDCQMHGDDIFGLDFASLKNDKTGEVIISE